MHGIHGIKIKKKPLKLFDSNSNCTEHVDREAQSIHSVNRVFIIHTEEGN
jgi:hypothetical protein